jgi:Zn-dependent peptidase ImmA (M78 family)/transcriptional regulator with XRE-family HTH domain
MALPASEIGHRIKRIREESGISQSRLASALGTDVATVERLEDGSLDPIPGDFVLIAARTLHIDFRLLISTDLDDVEEETRKVFRALSNPSPADLLAIRHFITLCINEAELEELLGVVRRDLPPNYPKAPLRGARYKDQGPAAAREERQRLRLGNLPVENVFELTRSQGIRLFRHKLEDSALSGVTILHPRAGVCILLNYHEDLYRQFFSAAHEYAHVLFDRQQISSEGCVVSYRFSHSELVEIRANAFAGEFLLPADALERYERPRDLPAFTAAVERIARDYRVNTEPVAIKAREANWISQRTLGSFQERRPVVIRRGEKIDPDIPSDLTPIQVERRTLAIQSGLTSSYLELLRRALATDVITFSRFAEMLEMGPQDAAEFLRESGLAV